MAKNRKTKQDFNLIQEFEVKIIKNFLIKPEGLLKITDKGLNFTFKDEEKAYLYNSIKSCEVKRSESLFYPQKFLSITLNNSTSPAIQFYPTDPIEGEFDPMEECLMLIGTFLE